MIPGETINTQGEGTTPEVEKGKTPTLTPEAQALINRANTALTDFGRLQAELKRSQSIAESALKRLKEQEETNLRREEESVRDDPEKLSALRLKRDAMKLKEEAETEREKIESEKSELLTQRQELRIHRASRLSERYNVATDVLLKYGGDTTEGMEELAKSFGEKAGESKRLTEPPDSGKTKGGSSKNLETLLKIDTRRMTQKELLEHAQNIMSASKVT